MDADTDLEMLLTLVAAGDRQAFAHLHRRTARHLLSVATRVLGDVASAEDVLQEAWLAVWQRAGQYDPSLAQPMTWLIALVRHRAIDAYRARRGLASREVVLDEGLPESSVMHTPGEAEHRLDMAQAWRAFDGLRPVLRQGLVLAWVHGLSHREVATRLGAPLGTVKVWLRRGLQQWGLRVMTAPAA